MDQETGESKQGVMLGNLQRDTARPPAEVEARHFNFFYNNGGFKALADINLASGKPVPQCLELLEQMQATAHSAVLSEKMADLYAAQGKPSSAAYEYAQALKLDPSPLQRVRLQLTLAAKLAELNRDEEAYETYLALLRDAPQYPDKLTVHKKLLGLAEKLKRTPDVEKWQSAITADAQGQAK